MSLLQKLQSVPRRFATTSHPVWFAVIITFVCTLLVFYLTPLKHLTLIQPTIDDQDPVELYEKMTAHPDDYIFIDVRPEAVYSKQHAVGSVNIPLYKMYFEWKNLPRVGKKIVLICSGGSAAGVAYGYLEHHGFLNLIRVEGGIENWIEKDLPTVSTLY